MKKLNLLCTIVMLAATVACIVVNFKAAATNEVVEATNICATVFYLLFWALMTRFVPAAKTTALIALYTMVAGMVAIFAPLGGWEGLFTNVFTAPAIMMFYGINFLKNLNILCGVFSVISFIILIYSLITLANKKPQPKKTAEEPVEEKAPAIEISETEMIAEAAKYVENINTFENVELELPQEDEAENAETAETAEEIYAEPAENLPEEENTVSVQ